MQSEMLPSYDRSMNDRNALTDVDALIPSIESSSELVLRSADRLDPTTLLHLADLKAMYSHDLRWRPDDIVAYLETARTAVLESLHRATKHAAASAEASTVVHVRDEHGFDYSMTLHKAFRREHDHVLDHLNQVEQWHQWHDDGVRPTPTDGWAGSDVLLDADLRPVSPAEAAAWSWRIDLGWRMLIRRAARATPELLDWQPPDGEWPLRQVLRHVGDDFYALWLSIALPDDPCARYAAASARFDGAVRQLRSRPPGHIAVGRSGAIIDPVHLIDHVLDEERMAITPPA
jgi:DinB superfamily